MQDQILIIISMSTFLVVGHFIRKSNTRSVREFTIGRGITWFPISAGISMTLAGGAAILNTASLGYLFKWYVLIDPLALFLGIMIVIVFYDKYVNDRGTTIANLLSQSDNNLGLLIGIITSFVFVLIVAAQFVALSKLISPYFPEIDQRLITFILSSAIFSYVFSGGFSSVTRTDVLQLLFIVCLLIAPVLFFLTFLNHKEIGQSSAHQFATMPLNYIFLFCIPIVFTPLSQDVNIRIKSAVDKKNGVVGLILGGTIYFSIVLSAGYIGIFLGESNVVLDDPETAYSVFFQLQFGTFGVMGVIAALAAIVSSLDSFSLNGITSISTDLLPRFVHKSPPALIKISSVILFTLSISIALFFNQILGLILTALLIYISLLLPIAVAKYIGLQDKYILRSAIMALLVIAGVEVMSIEIEPKAVLYPLGGLFIVFIAFTYQRLSK